MLSISITTVCSNLRSPFAYRCSARLSHSPEVIDRLRIPSSNSTLGSQPRIFFARVMSGWRTFGSSTGSGLYLIFDFVPVMRMISSANCLIVISRGLPMFTGSWIAHCESRKMPSIKSET